MLGLGNLLTKSGVIKKFPNDFSFNFDGSNDYLQIADNDSLSFGDGSSDSAFSISAWINPVDATRFSIASKATGSEVEWRFYCDDSDKLQLFLADDSISTNEKRVSTASISQNTWTHVAVTYDGSGGTSASSGINLYINGSLDNGTANGFGTYVAMHNHAIPVNIGFDDYDDKYANGKIDEVAVWDTALSASDVAKIASKPVDFSKASTYATDRTSNLKLWLRAGDKVLPEEDKSIARSDFYTDFDGVNDCISVSPVPSTTSTGSASFWVKNSADSGEAIFSFGNSSASTHFNIAIGDGATGLVANELVLVVIAIDGVFHRAGFSATGSDRNILVDGNWHHVAVTGDGSEYKIYIDGISKSINTTYGNGNNGAWSNVGTIDQFFIGKHSADGSDATPFEGQISSLALYQTALDAQTIKQFAKSRYTPMRDNRFSVVDFDGTDDTIQTSAHDTLADTTYTFWAKSDVTGANGGLFGHGGVTKSSFHFNYFGATGGARFFIGSNYFKKWDIDEQDDGQWHHYAIIADADSIADTKLYVDGVEQAASLTSSSGSPEAFTQSLTIGSDATSGNEWEGSIAQFAVYSELKDSAFVSAQWSKGITADFSSDANLSAYYKMGDDTSKAYPTIADSSSNSNDGTMTSMASDDIVQQMVAGYDMGAFESTEEELGGEKVDNNTSSAYGGGSESNIANVTNGVAITYAGTGTGLNATFSDASLLNTDIVASENKLHKLTFNAYYQGGSAGSKIRIYDQAVNHVTPSLTTTSASYSLYFRGRHASMIFQQVDMGSGNVVYITDMSFKEVLQSADLSDTYPAIIDVNEPVLGAELFSAWTNGNTGFGAYPAYDSFSFSNGVLNIAGTGSTANMTVWEDISLVANTVYKITYSVSGAIGGGNSSYFRFAFATKALETSLSVFNEQNTLQSDGDKIIYVQATSTATGYYGFRSANQPNLTISNFSIKAVSGNVGLMTNQDSADLVYSSVLPDQSFLTGVNSAYNFIDLDGTDYIDCGDGTSLDTVSQRTFSMWFKRDATTTDFLASRDDDGSNRMWSLYIYDNVLYYDFFLDGVGAGKGTAGSATISADTWYHVLWTNDGTNQVLYLNGSVDGTSSHAGTMQNADISLYLGRKASDYFNGKIGQTAMWNKALSATEVSAIYTLGRHGNILDSYSDNLVGYWAMSALDASSGISDIGNGTIYDRSGNSNHGTATNTASTDLASSPNAEPNGYAKGDTNRSTTTP